MSADSKAFKELQKLCRKCWSSDSADIWQLPTSLPSPQWTPALAARLLANSFSQPRQRPSQADHTPVVFAHPTAAAVILESWRQQKPSSFQFNNVGVTMPFAPSPRKITIDTWDSNYYQSWVVPMALLPLLYPHYCVLLPPIINLRHLDLSLSFFCACVSIFSLRKLPTCRSSTRQSWWQIFRRKPSHFIVF